MVGAIWMDAPCSLPGHGEHPGDGSGTAWRWFAIRLQFRDSSGAYLDGGNSYKLTIPANPRGTLLVICGLRPANPLDAAERGNALPQQEQQAQHRHGGERRWQHHLYFGPEAPEGLRPMGENGSRKGVVRHLPSLRPRPGVV